MRSSNKDNLQEQINKGCDAIFNDRGITSQLNKLSEEIDELSEETENLLLLEDYRIVTDKNWFSKTHFIEELADVFVVATQIRNALKKHYNKDVVGDIMLQKIDRTLDRYKIV